MFAKSPSPRPDEDPSLAAASARLLAARSTTASAIPSDEPPPLFRRLWLALLRRHTPPARH